MVNTGVVSSAHVTGDIGFKPTKGLKWKALCVVFKPDQKLMAFKQGHKPKENHSQRKLISCVVVVSNQT